mgnify:FL=1
MERTIQLLDSSGIRYAGTYKNLSERRQRYPLFINRNGFRIALLNYTYGTNGIKATSPNIVNYIDKNTILQDIQSAKGTPSRMPLLPACIGERNISPFPTVSNANWPTGCSNKA